MIGNPTVGLVQQIEKAQIANEAKLSKEVERPTFALDTESELQLRHFQSFCQTRGVRFLPAHPATVASFVFSENSYGVPPAQIMAALEAIETNHDNAGLANSVATSIVRAALGKILTIEGPRSWSKRERLLFNSLPIEVRAVIERRATADTKVVRRLQNEFALLKKDQTKGISNGT